ncbi:MAG: lipase family protein, partial [Gammaproteobacteria bacterium]|nr:lipase family protein [Gammaproteobacteria bacterium]
MRMAGGQIIGVSHGEYLMHEFEKPIDASIVEKSLIGLPSHRVGYSDRTAWLMATLSQLAYFQFENKKTISEVAADLARLTNKEEISSYLQNIIGALDHGDAESRRNFLAQILKCGEFELIDVFDVGSTQAFLARRQSENERDRMLVLAFRGTEKRLEDWKADLKAKLVPARDEVKIGRIHQGFQEAYYSVENPIEESLKRFPGEPLYITGHSLGGALAVVATRFIDANNIAACYTYGCPRVGDLELAKVFKSPIYRIVNSADAVPRLPFGYGYVLLLKLV